MPCPRCDALEHISRKIAGAFGDPSEATATSCARYLRLWCAPACMPAWSRLVGKALQQRGCEPRFADTSLAGEQ